jgi:antirestriction protein ArdC
MTTKTDLYQTVTDQVLDLMNQHGADWVKPWTGTGIPTNASTGAEYQGSNILMLGMAAFAKGYESHHWATYKQWQAVGAQVRRGEQSTVGILFKPLVKEDDDGTERKIPMIKAFRVFNADQVDGWTPPVVEGQGEAERIDAAETFIGNTGADIRHGDAGAFYVPDLDRISLPHRETFTATATSTATEAYYGTALHELGHWSGAKHRLARDLSGRFGTAKYAGEELVAELTSAFLCAHLGISPTPRADHAQYLNAWMQKLREDKRAFLTAASAAQKAADYLRDLQEAETLADAA